MVILKRAIQAGGKAFETALVFWVPVASRFSKGRSVRFYFLSVGAPLRVGNAVRRELCPVLEKLKIAKKGLHAFRHFRVTMLVEAGVPIRTIKAWIGHGSERMAARYTHSRPACRQQHLAKVPSVLDSSYKWSVSSYIEVVGAVA